MPTLSFGESPVLVVEDDRLVADALVCLLEDLEIPVAGVASTGTKALELLSCVRPKIALVDVGLKGAMDGIQLALELRRHGVPSIFLTGQWSSDISERAKAAEPIGHLLKPYTSDQLRAVLSRALNHA